MIFHLIYGWQLSDISLRPQIEVNKYGGVSETRTEQIRGQNVQGNKSFADVYMCVAR